MGLIEIVVLAVVQGLTEFLPISSSGHLVIVDALINPDRPLAPEAFVEVSIVLHAGTFLSILAFYWRRIWRLFGSDRRTLALLVVGSVPAAVVGVTLKLYGAPVLSHPLVAGSLLPITGLVLLAVPRLARGDEPYGGLSWWGAWWIGVTQAVAILPGISRSGTTIAAGLANRLSRQSAATFSFLLALPVIAGAAMIEAVDLLRGHAMATPLLYLGVGMIVSFVAGLLALWWVVRWLEQGRLQYFAAWCIPVGVGVVIWQLRVLLS